MKNVTSLKASKIESPKTPGGISKSLLTPCRRVGLSRNWKKAGPSPFVSPLTTSNSTTTEPKIEKKETRKRKVRTPTEELEEEVAESPVVVGLAEEDDAVDIFSSKTEKIVNTPSRPVETPRRKKSKTVLPGISKSKSIATSKILTNVEVLVQNEGLLPTPASNESESNLNSQENCKTVNTPDIQENPTENMAVEVATPISTKSASKLRKMKSNSKFIDTIKTDHEENCKTVAKNQNVKENHEIPTQVTEKIQYEVKRKSPNDLTKECVVVIQKKMFRTDKAKKSNTNTKKQNKENSLRTVKNTVSQTLYHSDSDSDEVPLCQLNNKLNKKEPEIITIDEDDDFETKITEIPVKKLDKNTSTGGLKPKTQPKTKNIKPKKSVESKLVEANFSNSFDDDEDFDFDNKKTILVRKTYDKTSKPQKAKSTGSITQRDIDELRARIERKKKMLMAKAMTEDTEELRMLIKKWQKGCQDALMELMELMKTKFPEKDNMDYAEMLQTLKIPALLVGFDEDNDCFNTPSDDNVMLTTFKDV